MVEVDLVESVGADDGEPVHHTHTAAGFQYRQLLLIQACIMYIPDLCCQHLIIQAYIMYIPDLCWQHLIIQVYIMYIPDL